MVRQRGKPYLPIKREGRSGHDWQIAYMAWSAIIALAAAFLVGFTAGGAIGELLAYLRQHGW